MAAVFVLFVLLALVAPVVLYYLVRAEHDERETMDRQAAERTARRDSAESEQPEDKC